MPQAELNLDVLRRAIADGFAEDDVTAVAQDAPPRLRRDRRRSGRGRLMEKARPPRRRRIDETWSAAGRGSAWWLADRAGTGSADVVSNMTEFSPGKTHGLHRHPNAEEVLFVLEEGLHLSEGEPVRQRAGEVVFIPRGEWHGAANDSEAPTT